MRGGSGLGGWLARRVLAVLVGGLTTAAVGAAPAAAHGERAQEPFLRTRTFHWYDVSWSATKLTVNGELVVTGKFRVFDEWPVNIPEPTTVFLGVGTPGATFARKASYINGTPMIQSTGLELGRDYQFKYVLQARIPGRHHVHPMINVQGAGGLLGPGQWIEVSGNAADFRYPVTTLTGVAIPNLETYGLRGVAFWHILWAVIALAWVLWWIRRPLFLPRNALVEKGQEDLLVTSLDRKLGAALLIVTLVIVIAGFRWAGAAYPRTIPLQGGKVKLAATAAPEQRVAVALERATYDVPGRSMRLGLRVTNNGDQALRLGELSTANLRFINLELPAAVAAADPTYPADLLARTGLSANPDQPIQPGETRVLQVTATDAAWETERLTSFLNDPDSRFGAMLFFYEPGGTRHISTVGGPIIPIFVRG